MLFALPPQLCFAHLGAIPNNRLHALTRYNHLGTVSTRYFAISLDDGSDQDELLGSKQSGWRYSCVNLYEYFTVSNTVSAQGSEHIVLRFTFDYPARGEDFWVDSVSVTQSMPAVTDPCGCGWVWPWVGVARCGRGWVWIHRCLTDVFYPTVQPSSKRHQRCDQEELLLMMFRWPC